MVHLCSLITVVKRFDLCVFLTVSGLNQEDERLCQRELNNALFRVRIGLWSFKR